MYFRKTSIAVVVVILIVTSTTLLLGAYGIVRYREDRDNEWAALREETAVNADQLAIALSLPAWNIDNEQIDRNIESGMQDRDIYGIAVRVADQTRIRIRDANGKVVTSGHEVTGAGLLAEKRPIAHLKDTIGTVEVFATPKFVEENLNQARKGMITVIVSLDLALVLSLYFLLWRIVLKPLRQLELYALAVSSGQLPQTNLDQCRYRGELESLRFSLDKMIHLLEERYDALQISEERYRTVVEFSPECIAVGVDERVAFINPAGARMFGAASPEEMLGRSVYDFVPPEFLEITKARRRKVVEEGVSIPPAEFTMLRRDGSQICVEAQAAPFVFGGHPAVLNLIRDITARKLAEDGLRRSEFRYRTLFQAAPDAIFMLSGECWYDCNPHALKLFGCPREEIIGQTPMRFSPPRQPDGADSIYKAREKIQAALFGEPQLFEWRHCRRDGTEFDAEVSFTRIELDEQPILLAVVRDITDRKRGVQLLRESEEKFSKAFRSSPTGIAITELESGRYIEVNEGFCGICGYTQEEMIGHSSLELGVFETPADRDRVIDPVRTRGSVHDFPMRLRTRKGETKTLLVNLERIELRGKQCVLCVLYDITARLQAEERLQSSREQLRALTSRLQSLREEERTHLAREIHDHLGQLLTALSLDLRLIERKAAHVSDLELRAVLQGKIASARGLADETITSVQKIASELRPAILDRLGLDAAIEAESRAFQDRTGVQCGVALPEIPVTATPEQATAIFRVFQEILTNVARHAKATHVTVSLAQTNRNLLMTVTDDGAGIHDTDLENPKSLGLLGMRERAQILGGSVTFARNGTAGTSVTVTVPLQRHDGNP